MPTHFMHDTSDVSGDATPAEAFFKPTTHHPLRHQVDAVDIDRLPAGAVLTIVTFNSTYHVIVKDPIKRRVFIVGGKFFPMARFGWVEGSVRGDGYMCAGRVEVGTSLALWASEQPIVTSRIFSIAVDMEL